MSTITVLYAADSISLLYSLYPILRSVHLPMFRFTKRLDVALRQGSSKRLLIVRYFKQRYDRVNENVRILQRLKDRYEKVFLFDDSDGADSIHFELSPWLDGYFKKQLLRDRSLYLQEAYGRQRHSDYYHRNHGVVDPTPLLRSPPDNPDELDKLHVAWNLGFGAYPVRQRRSQLMRLLEMGLGARAACVALPDCPLHRPQTTRIPHIQMRFSSKHYAPSIGRQRQLLLERAQGDPLFRTGFTSHKAFQKELGTLAGVVSPFGWGEICFRDFETIRAGAALLKPAMDHLETWPDIYRHDDDPAESAYVPLCWDGGDLLDKARAVVDNPAMTKRVVANALDVYNDAWSAMEQRVEMMLDAILT